MDICLYCTFLAFEDQGLCFCQNSLYTEPKAVYKRGFYDVIEDCTQCFGGVTEMVQEEVEFWEVSGNSKRYIGGYD